MKRKFVVLALAAALSLAACARVTAPAGEPTRGGHAGMGGDMDDVRFGSPGDPSDASRTIAVEALDTMRFEPAQIAVREGETVTFSVTNPGNAIHELTFGDAGFQ